MLANTYELEEFLAWLKRKIKDDPFLYNIIQHWIDTYIEEQLKEDEEYELL